jgi:hypothetical protein
MDEIYYLFNPWWEKKPFETGIAREDYLKRLSSALKRKQIEVVVGGRRVGKTTLLKQLIKEHLSQGYPANQILYLALDHPQLSRSTISEHLRNFRKLFMHNRTQRLLLFLDEVQENPNWQIELKSIYDTEPVKIICTGSTSALIKNHQGKLTGRQIVTPLYPLSFKEFLSFKQAEPSQAEEYKYEKLVEDYLRTGGYPEYVLNPSAEYLSNLLEDIIARDLIRLYYLKRPDLLKDLLRLLAANIGTRISFNKLSHTLGVSVDTIKEYIGYFESAYLVQTMEKWSTSYTNKIYSAKKVYLSDTGIKTLFTGKGDLGLKAENAVFLHLVRNRQSCGYFAETEREVDFVLGDLEKPLPLEVKYISEFSWSDKRFAGLKLFLRRFPQTKKVLIISKDIERETRAGKVTINLIPLWKYLLR